MIKALKNLLGLALREDATAGELAPSLPAAEAELAAAREAQAAAEAAYRAQLLTADETALRKLVDARIDAGVRVDRASALVDALGERLAAARDREAEADRVIAYEAARKQADEAREALAQLYPQFANGLTDLLRAVADAEIVVSQVNDDLPRGAERLAGVEASVRDVPGSARELVGEQVVELWCRPGERMPGTLNQAQVQIGNGGGGIIRPPSGPVMNVVKRKYIERRYAESAPGNFAYRLAVTLNLPGLRANEPPIFKAADPIATPSPREVLRMLDGFAAYAASPTEPPRPERVELELISEVDPEREQRQYASILDRVASRA
jgi:hypothetical protein